MLHLHCQCLCQKSEDKIKSSRHRIPGTNKRVKESIVEKDGDQLQAESEDDQHGNPSPESPHILSNHEPECAQDNLINTAKLVQALQTNRPSIFYFIPRDAQDSWVAFLNMVAERANCSSEATERERYTILFVCAPFFVLRHEKGEKEVDINAKLLNAIAHPEYRMFADVTTEKREQPSVIQRAIILIQANNTSKALKLIKRGKESSWLMLLGVFL